MGNISRPDHRLDGPVFRSFLINAVSIVFERSETMMKSVMITVRVNDQICEVPPSISLEALLVDHTSSSKGIAVAVNQQVVSRAQWREIRLNQNDQVLIIKATQGG